MNEFISGIENRTDSTDPKWTSLKRKSELDKKYIGVVENRFPNPIPVAKVGASSVLHHGGRESRYRFAIKKKKRLYKRTGIARPRKRQCRDGISGYPISYRDIRRPLG